MSKKIGKTQSQSPRNITKVGKVKYHSNGKVKSKGFYVNGEKHGLETKWDENGVKRNEVNHKAGNPHGLWIKWREDGSKWFQTMWEAGAEQGIQTDWYNSGERAVEIYLIQNKELTRIDWDKEGNVIRTDFPTLPKTQQQSQSLNRKITFKDISR